MNSLFHNRSVFWVSGLAFLAAVAMPLESFSRGGGHGGGHNGGHSNSHGFHGHHGGHSNSAYWRSNSKHHHHHEYDHWHTHNNYYGRWAGATLGAVAVGSIVYSLPASCVKIVRNGVAYKRCEDNWFAPRYQGSNVVYVAVRAP